MRQIGAILRHSTAPTRSGARVLTDSSRRRDRTGRAQTLDARVLVWLTKRPDVELTRPREGSARYRGGGPKTIERVAAASRFAHRRVDSKSITLLEKRSDVIAYFERLVADAQFQAKAMLSQDIAANIEARREGLQQMSQSASSTGR
jgi:hypothetical protein